MTILLHSSKTMRTIAGPPARELREPELLAKTRELASYLRTLTPRELAKAMHLSAALAEKTHTLLQQWSDTPARQSAAMDSFVGDIYSGLRASTLSTADRDYADKTLRILSGLYGILRPYDGICPYRLEMGYRMPDARFTNLYAFWKDSIAACLPATGAVINLASAEYSRAVLPFVDPARVITPRFLTREPESGEPAFVVVHAKIARGAFARWLITSRAEKADELTAFADIGYAFNAQLSTPEEPVFVCREFGGKGLSMRLET